MPALCPSGRRPALPCYHRPADSGLRSAGGNVLALPAGLTIDPSNADNTLRRLFELKGRYARGEWVRLATAWGASVLPPEVVAEAAPAPPPEPEGRPAEPTLEDLEAQLRVLGAETARPGPTAAPSGPPCCSPYPWRMAMELAGSAGDASAGATRILPPGAEGDR